MKKKIISILGLSYMALMIPNSVLAAGPSCCIIKNRSDPSGYDRVTSMGNGEESCASWAKVASEGHQYKWVAQCPARYAKDSDTSGVPWKTAS